jgi:hypothetical protein
MTLWLSDLMAYWGNGKQPKDTETIIKNGKWGAVANRMTVSISDLKADNNNDIQPICGIKNNQK